MSHGRLPGDILVVIDQLYRKCEAAGGKYLEVSKELGSLHTILRHLFEIETTEHGSQPIPIIRNCDHTLRQLDDLLHKYRKPVDERDGWDGPRFASSEIDSLNKIRMKLHDHITTLAVLVDTVQLRNDTHVSRTAGCQEGQLDIILDKLDKIAERMGQREGSVLTSYGSDDKEIWKEFRRELIAEGFSSDVLQRNKDVLRAYIREIEQKGLLTETPPTPVSASHSVSSAWLHSVPPGRPPGIEAENVSKDEAAKEVLIDEDNIKFPQSIKLERARPTSQYASRDIQHAVSALTINTERDNKQRTRRFSKSPKADSEEDSSSDESYTSSRHGSRVSIMRTSDLTESNNLSVADKNFLRPPQSRRPNHLQLESRPNGNSRSSSPASINSTGSRSRPAVLTESPTELQDYSSSPRRKFEPIPIPKRGKINDDQYSKSPRSNSFTLAPDSMGNKIPVDAKWTKIRRSLVSLEVLDQDGHRYEARPEFVAVLGVLGHEEIEDLAYRSIVIREARYQRHEAPRQPSPRKAPQNFRYTRAKKGGYGTPSDDEDSSSEPELENPQRHLNNEPRQRSSDIPRNHKQSHSNAPPTPNRSPNLQPPPSFRPQTSPQPPPTWQSPQNYPYPYAPPEMAYGKNIPLQTFGYYPPPQPTYSTYPQQENTSHRNRRHVESDKYVSQGRNAGRKRWRENLAAVGLGGAAVSLLSVLSEAAAEF